MSIVKNRSIRQQLLMLALLFAGSAAFATSAAAMIWESGGSRENLIDCRGELVCGDTCDPYRTNWQGVQCFFGLL